MSINNDSVLFQISHDIYWGFQFRIPSMEFDNLTEGEIIERVITTAKAKMTEFFNTHNLLQLRDKVNSLELGMHYNNLRQVINSGNTVFVCGHC